jgi:hypothetical protein
MSDQLVEGTTPYVTQNDLLAIEARLLSRVDTLGIAIENRLNEKLREDISSVRQEVSAQWVQIDNKLDEIDRKVASVNGTLNGWDKVIASRDQAYADNRVRIAGIEARERRFAQNMSKLAKMQVSNQTLMQTLFTTIHGNKDKPDGPPSLFASIETLGQKIEIGFTRQQTQFRQVARRVQQNRQDIQVLSTWQAAYDQRWAARREYAIEWINYLLRNPSFWFALVIVVSTFLGLQPRTNETKRSARRMMSGWNFKPRSTQPTMRLSRCRPSWTNWRGSSTTLETRVGTKPFA